MWKIIDFVERHKFGILIAVVVYIGIFISLNLQTYTRWREIDAWPERSEIIEEEIVLNPEQIEQQAIPIDQGAPAKSIANDVSDKRERSTENWSRNKESKSAEQRIKDLEKQFYNETGESQKRAQIKKEMEALKKEQQKQQSSTSNNTAKSTTTDGGSTAYKGRTMVNWELKNREPHQGNEWYVRNPGYTCGKGQNGIVFIKIKVNQNGTVTSATYIPEKSNAPSACMIEQAKKYAMMSRFAFSSSAPTSQEGWIMYEFVAG